MKIIEGTVTPLSQRQNTQQQPVEYQAIQEPEWSVNEPQDDLNLDELEIYDEF